MSEKSETVEDSLKVKMKIYEYLKSIYDSETGYLTIKFPISFKHEMIGRAMVAAITKKLDEEHLTRPPSGSIKDVTSGKEIAEVKLCYAFYLYRRILMGHSFFREDETPTQAGAFVLANGSLDFYRVAFSREFVSDLLIDSEFQSQSFSICEDRHKSHSSLRTRETHSSLRTRETHSDFRIGVSIPGGEPSETDDTEGTFLKVQVVDSDAKGKPEGIGVTLEKVNAFSVDTRGTSSDTSTHTKITDMSSTQCGDESCSYGMSTCCVVDDEPSRVCKDSVKWFIDDGRSFLRKIPVDDVWHFAAALLDEKQDKQSSEDLTFSSKTVRGLIRCKKPELMQKIVIFEEERGISDFRLDCVQTEGSRISRELFLNPLREIISVPIGTLTRNSMDLTHSLPVSTGSRKRSRSLEISKPTDVDLYDK
jgi:hypothetical protein